jgi:homoserine O-acetyltransferase
MVERVLPSCGSAKTSVHNFVFLEGVKAALTADDAWNNGWYDQQPTKGLRAMARVYAGWGFSQAFYRETLYRKMSYASLEDFLVGFWEGFFLVKDANNLLAMLWTWQNGDISANPKFNGDFGKALGAIKAKSIVMPGKTDLYFPPEDNELEAQQMPSAECRPFPSIWGHFAGGPGLNPDDVKFIDNALKELLAA